MPIASVNPATGETLREFAALNLPEIDKKLAAAEAAFHLHRRTAFAERSRMLQGIAHLLEVEKLPLGRLISSEMGKPIREAMAEVEKCALVCRFYADHAERFLQARAVEGRKTPSHLRFEPLGIVLAIMPWNFPFWQVFRFAAPALMTGNVGLLKHAANVPQCALAIEDLFHRAGAGEGVFQALLIENEQVGAIIEDRRVKAVTLTGSERAGAAVASAAGKALKKCVLELGGSDPFIVMPSAKLEEALALALKARVQNAGQSCIAAKRFLIADSLYDDFARQFTARMKALRVGDPLDEETEIGPLANEQIRDGLHRQMEALLAGGARLLTGGRRLDRPGYFYAPTVLENVPPHLPAAQEEVFGPVAILYRVRDAAAAVELANRSPFGLGASVWTQDPAEQELFIRELEVGMVFCNAMVASDPRLPFGGIKRSGFGRELGAEGIREFVNIKTVVTAG